MWRNCRQQSIIIGMAKYRGGENLNIAGVKMKAVDLASAIMSGGV
jgi:hypothetical protein